MNNTIVTEIRHLIVENNITEAFKTFDNIIPDNDRNDLHLLWAQFSQWERQNRLNLGADSVEWNRIIYGLFGMLSEIELSGNINVARTKKLATLEREIEKGYTKLTELQATDIDTFMMWLKSTHTGIFNQLIKLENANESDYTRLLNAINWTQYTEDNKLSYSAESAYKHILDVASSEGAFFADWISYHNYRTRYIKDLEHIITKYKNSHSHLISGSIIGSFLGSITTFFITRGIDDVINDYENDYVEENEYGDEIVKEENEVTVDDDDD